LVALDVVPQRIRVMRVITRLMVGGPALQAALLTQRLDPERFETLLVAGRESATEGSMLDLGRLGDVRAVRVSALGREISPFDDVRAVAALTGIARSFRPHIVHTHLAKAGALGRPAARLAGASAVIHTFHGTVFKGYFSDRRSAMIVNAERVLARMSTRLIAITPSQRQELIDRGIGDSRKVVEIPLGLDLTPLTVPLDRTEARSRLGLPLDRPIVAIVARLVPVKNVELFLRAFARLKEPAMAIVVGDGSDRADLEHVAGELDLNERCRFVGWQADMRAVYAAADIVALSSKSEGSPVSLIEAMAAGRAVVSTNVGGIPDVIEHGATGLLVPPEDPAAFADALDALLARPDRISELGKAAKQAVYPRYDVSRLLTDIAALYESLLRSPAAADRH
jgi:glycosyltransferase involved in cell wall biosynthesis